MAGKKESDAEVNYRIIKYISFFLIAGSALIAMAGCGDNSSSLSVKVSTRTTPTTATTAANPLQPGIALDPALQSVTGMPTPDEMKPLITLQAKIPYPVMVSTQVPSGYRLDADLIGSSGPTAKDPVGYYSFRYSDPGNESRTLTFNQSHANSRPLSGYYLTEIELNGTVFQVYWHKTSEYLPAGEPVRTTSVGNAEVFVVVWSSQYTDASGQPQELWYSMSTGTWTGHGWGDIQTILAGIKPLSAVGS